MFFYFNRYLYKQNILNTGKSHIFETKNFFKPNNILKIKYIHNKYFHTTNFGRLTFK